MNHYLGIDLGGTNIAIGMVNETGKLLCQSSTPTESKGGYPHVLGRMIALAEQVIADSGIARDTLRAVGIGSPGICDSEAGIIRFASNLDFHDVPICADLHAHFNLPVNLENDANAAALGEGLAGAARGTKSSVTITLGTGLGSGIVVEERIVRGMFGCGGEFGHSTIKFDGLLCGCGLRGCYEMYASTTGLIRQAREAAQAHPNSMLSTNVEGDLSAITGRTIFAAKHGGDDMANQVVDQYLDYVTIGLANLASTLCPEAFVIGGGLSAQGDTIILPLREKTEKYVFGGKLYGKIVAATLGNDAGIIGAAIAAK